MLDSFINPTQAEGESWDEVDSAALFTTTFALFVL